MPGVVLVYDGIKIRHSFGMLHGIRQGQEIGMLHGVVRMVIEFLATLCISGDDPRVVPRNLSTTCVSAEVVDVSMNQRRDAGEVGRIDRVPLGLEVLDDGLDVDGVPEGDDVEHEAECAKLFLLAFPVACGEFAATTVAEFLPVELDEDAPALLAIVDVVEHMARLDDTSKFGECRASGVGRSFT